MKPSLAALLLVFSLAACGEGSGSADAAPPRVDAAQPTGTFSVSWTIKDENGATVDCATVGAGEVVITLRPSDGTPGFPESFTCSAGMGKTAARPAQSYAIDFKIKDSLGHELDALDPLLGKMLVAGTDTALDPVVFNVARTGSLAFKIDANGSTNCGLENTGGAGLTGVRVELRNVAGTNCIPTTFDVGGFSCGVVAACIEKTQVITAAAVPAGDYSLSIEGFEGGSTTMACYKTARQVTVSGGGLVTNLNSVSVPIVTGAGCMVP